MLRSRAGRRHPLAALAALAWRTWVAWVGLSGWFVGAAEGVEIRVGSEGVQFNRDIRPVLSDKCFACHGFDPAKRKAGLRLDVAEGALGVGKSGRVAIRPGDLEGSEVWRRLVTTDPDDLMPPKESHKQVTPAERELIRRWIEAGALYQRHWSFEPPVAVTLPATTPGGAPLHPVDALLGERLAREGLAFGPEADRPTLIRRVTFDLTGLPPTLAEVDAFLADPGPGAYGRLVERLLDSPRYGEQLARHWLDVARYADTHGMHLDNERQIWPYRDWVVRAFNQNLPFDQFTVDQLAGDLVSEPTRDQLIATGFNRNNVTTGEGGSIDAEYIFRYAVDRTATTAQAWLGLTAGCAVCHDHKFDPISAKEFYSLYAFFHSAADPPMDGNALRTPPMLRLTTPEHEARLAELAGQVEAAEVRLPVALAGVTYTDPASLVPPPPARDVEEVWADDAIPAGWKITAGPGAPTEFVDAPEVGVASGKRALRRKDRGLAQDVIEAGPTPFEVPDAARLFAHVFLDPADPPKAIMLQYRTGGWQHRAVWGDYQIIDWGAKGTTERVDLGALPKTGEWVRLEFEASVVGLKQGDRVNGFALTQHGGTVLWDKVGITGRTDPVTDPTRSLLAWKRQYEGREAKDVPEAFRALFQGRPAKGWTPDQERKLREYFLGNVCADTRTVFEPLRVALATAKRAREEYEATIPTTFVWKDLEQRRESFVMQRGAYDRPGERVFPNVPAAFPPLANTNNPTRLDLARWLVGEANPLTARVTVNRFWQLFYGVGLVKTSDDFGSQGEPPSHPELLDWLAVRLQSTGWDVKALVRLLVTSAAYRQSSHVTPDLLQRDPGNRLLARGPRFRLDAEQIRDNALFVSGLLVQDMGGKGVRTYQPPNIWEPVGFVGSNTREYKPDQGPALYRRSLYTFFKRTAPAPFMVTFDAPNREQSCTRRERSNTPLQALLLMNDVQHFEAARALAERMLVEGGSTPEARLAFGFRTVLARVPEGEELTVIKGALEAHLARYAADVAAAKQVIAVGESTPAEHLAAPELAAYTLAANLLLNLDETVTRN